MVPDGLTDISNETKQSLYERLKSKDVWLLEDLVLFIWGLEDKGFCWESALYENSFPARQYWTAVEAIKSPDEKPVCVQEKLKDGRQQYFLKKGSFLIWAEKEWGKYPQVRKMFGIYKCYKNMYGSPSLSMLSTEAKVRDYAEEVQLRHFEDHCRSNTLTTYKKLKRVDLAKIVKKEMKLQLNQSSVNQYVGKVLSLDELLVRAEKNKKINSNI